METTDRFYTIMNEKRKGLINSLKDEIDHLESILNTTKKDIRENRMMYAHNRLQQNSQVYESLIEKIIALDEAVDLHEMLKEEQ
jgi:hypothetical protein